MFFKFSNKKISGILSVVPENIVKFEDEVHQYNFPPKRTLKLKEVMGYSEHRIVVGDVTASDMAIFGLEYLFDNNLLDKNKIDGLLFVSHTPDYVIPPTSSVIQGKLGLKRDMFCLDINQGCAGFVMGLIQAFMMLDSGAMETIVLINADTLSRKVSKQDRNAFPLIGDAACISIIEKGSSDAVVSVIMDGSQYDSVMIPAGGMRMPSTPETARLQKLEDGNERSLEHFAMNGVSVMNFVQTIVIDEVKNILKYAGKQDKDIFGYCFHQPNKFIVEKLAEALDIDLGKVPSNIVTYFGNSSGPTIPMVVTYNYAEILQKQTVTMCLSGFGDGLTCASMVMDIGNMTFCNIIEYK